MAGRRKGPKDLRRKTASRPERKTVLIFCEGEASEPDDLNALKRLPEIRHNTAISLIIDPAFGLPMELVSKAAERLRRDPDIDECWCVFDVEWPQHHPHLDRALRLAAAEGVRIAVSNPCFELWLMLHFQDHSGFLQTRDAEVASRHLDGRSGKRLDGAKYMPLRHDACERASRLAVRHERNDSTFPDDNPSSTMHELLAALEPPDQH
ncbi:RloB family protein [Kribbella sp. NPDC048928]|uniref:RloB family protein n=1 Tax=Kribbella sp. NPDC048928 TaxID=3364111 RepID=UPI00371AF857